MRTELDCTHARVELSARLDGEVDAVMSLALDEHLAGCPACRRHERELAAVRTRLRIQPADDMPDIAASLSRRLRSEGTRVRNRREWRLRFRIAAVAAAISALILLGTSVPWLERGSDVARADEIARLVRAAALSVDEFEAAFAITEFGWHREVERRQFLVDLRFSAPESFAIEVVDRTTYPSAAWPRNDAAVISDGARVWTRSVTACPVDALPECEYDSGAVEHLVVGQVPFGGDTPAPTDVVVPLETLAASPDFPVARGDEVLDRATYRITLPYIHAIPLVRALRPGENWRPFHPLDIVTVWVDPTTWVPLRFEVRVGASSDRAAWADANGLAVEPAGRLLLSVRALALDEDPELGPNAFTVPRSGSRSLGLFREDDPVAVIADLPVGLKPPTELAGLPLDRAGTVSATSVLSYASGLTWLRVEISRDPYTTAPIPTEEVGLSDGGSAYYRPADQYSGRRIDLRTRTARFHIESNLARADLLAAAAALPGVGRDEPADYDRRARFAARRLSLRSLVPIEVAKPAWLPAGYGPGPAAVYEARGPRTRTISAIYFQPEADFGQGIEITIAPHIRRLPPSSEELIGVAVRGASGRWSTLRGELEWISEHGYRAVSVPTFDLATALRIARSLR